MKVKHCNKEATAGEWCAGVQVCDATKMIEIQMPGKRIRYHRRCGIKKKS